MKYETAWIVFGGLCVNVLRLAALFGGAQEPGGAPPTVPEEIRLTCTQFVRYHKNQCVQDVVHKKRSVYMYEDANKVNSLRMTYFVFSSPLSLWL